MMGLTHLGFAYFIMRILEEGGILGSEGWMGIGFLLFGALLPDVDSPFSLIGRVFKPLSYKLKAEFGHRSLTHSLIIPILVALIYLFSRNEVILSFLLGYTSHILLDLLSIKGVRLLWPLDLYFVILGGRIKVGGKLDYLLFFLFNFLSLFPQLIFYPLSLLK